MKVGTCRGCGARMLWCVTINGNPQPFDVEPVDGGEFVLLSRHHVGDGSPLALAVTHLDDDARGQLPNAVVARHMPHHATCPEAGQFRKASSE
jgi:hypothetical protein